jgi:hypothetical protein
MNAVLNKTIFKSENGIFATDILIFDSVFRSKLRIVNPGACAREYNSIMQIIMEALIGWYFHLNFWCTTGMK